MMSKAGKDPRWRTPSRRQPVEDFLFCVARTLLLYDLLLYRCTKGAKSVLGQRNGGGGAPVCTLGKNQLIFWHHRDNQIALGSVPASTLTEDGGRFLVVFLVKGAVVRAWSRLLSLQTRGRHCGTKPESVSTILLHRFCCYCRTAAACPKPGAHAQRRLAHH